MDYNYNKLKRWIKEQWGVTPQQISYYKEAVTLPKYEVLEYLGDSLLDFIVADFLVKRFPGKDPGWLTKKRMSLVNETALGKIAKSIKVSSVCEIPETSSWDQLTPRVLGDMVEALIAAIYLDSGIEDCRNAVIKVFKLEELTDELNGMDINPIGTLQEFLAVRGFPPAEYNLLRMRGECHTPIFTVEVKCRIGNEILVTQGEGNNKKEANKNAAQKMLKKLQNMPLPSKDREDIKDNPIGDLQTLLQRKKLPLPIYEVVSQEGEAHCPTFTVKVSCAYGKGKFITALGKGRSKKEAKKRAAKNILEKLKKVLR